ncbi:MAG: Alpha/beta hydrolase fold-3 [Rhodobacteraceae bacterium]|uniref:alpha/beta hydrolase n=1 Tax=Cypionkella sp. TaxID=2811411 RepID=UPI0013249C9F|nr:alpha/beta hydrolase [Cypionkella sp.]KAF0175820.1 MAG: Alpha/beta hydrolase fold-3 [Paracoccaceae bacterium]MDO8326482.1 alpha/beta hydrolase [Cypionkella sp.]
MAISKEADTLRALYQSWTDQMVANPNLTIANLRSMFDAWGQPALEPASVTYKSDHLGGVEAIWALPVGADTSRVIVYTHGGGFAVGSADSHRKMAGHLARALGVTACILHYRRAPEHAFPAQIEDAVAAYKALLAKGYEAKNLLTAGDSAGGNLAVASVLKFRDLGLPLPGAVIAYSPWLDMALRGKTLETNAATDALVGKPILEAMAGMFLSGATDPLNPLANPLENDFKGFPPLYITCGGAETLQSDSESLFAKAKAQGVNVALSVVPGMQHVFPALSGRAPEADQELARIAAWYRAL